MDRTKTAARNAAEHIRCIARDRYSTYVMLVSLCYAKRKMLLSDSAADAFGDLYERIVTNSSHDEYPMRFAQKIFATDFYLSDAKAFKGVLDELPNDPMSLQ